MGDVTNIAWTHHTFNGWIGCHRISEACRFCYAAHETPVRVHRQRGLELWGKDAARHVTGDDNWRKPLKWNRDAMQAGERRRVFCASLADVFEDRRDLDVHRARLWDLIAATPWLDWLLLSKRWGIADIPGMVPAAWSAGWPRNVWAGATVENQRAADERIPHLLRIPAVVRFLSMEPLLEAVDLDPPTCPSCEGHDAVTGSDGATLFCREHGDEMAFSAWLDPCASAKQAGINWVIVGGESGPKARPFDLAWARAIRDQCREAEVACFVKQIGARPQPERVRVPEAGPDAWMFEHLHIRDSHGGDPSKWPADLRVREFPTMTP